NWNNSKSNDLIKFVQRQVQCDPENVTLRIMLSQIMSKIGKKEESSAIIKDVLSKISFDDENYLLCLQALVDAGEWSLAERSAEIFLVNKKNSEANDYLSIAFVFDQLDKPDKSISVLNHLDTMDSSLL